MKTKLTPELQKKLIKYIQGGSYIVVACRAVGIAEKTFYEWIKKGEKGIEPYSKLSKSIRQAQAIGELKIFSEIRSQVKNDWRAGMEILARKYPQRWGKKDKLEVKSKKTVLTKQIIEFRKEEKKLTEDERKQLVEFTMKAEKEFMESNANNGGSKNE